MSRKRSEKYMLHGPCIRNTKERKMDLGIWKARDAHLIREKKMEIWALNLIQILHQTTNLEREREKATVLFLERETARRRQKTEHRNTVCDMGRLYRELRSDDENKKASSSSSSSSLSDALLFATICFVGLPVDVHVKDGSVFSGIFHTASVHHDYGLSFFFFFEKYFLILGCYYYAKTVSGYVLFSWLIWWEIKWDSDLGLLCYTCLRNGK